MRLLWRIYLPFFACALVALAVTAGYASQALNRLHRRQVAEDLLVRARVLASELARHALDREAGQADARCKEFGRLTGARVSVILPDGRVIGDSDHEPARMDDHGTRPEIAAALGGQTGTSVRFSDTLRRTLMYLAIPVTREGEVVAVVRTAQPVSAVEETLRRVYGHLALVVALVAAGFALVAYVLARQISRPLEDMRRTAERLARGDLQARAALPAGGELAALARALNQMAGQLGERLALITRQRDQQQAVFASMVEGVLAVDGDGRILDVNAAAGRLLDLAPDQARGRSIQEAVRNPDLQAFIAATLAAGSPAEEEILLYGQAERSLQLHGAALADSSGGKPGAVVVLNDITRVKRLETVRREFVANVSHELKTPITAIQGCLETLTDRSPRSPEDDERFLAMLGRQVGRLRSIVEDLLSLSRLEHEAENKRIPLEPGPVGDVLRRAVQSLARAAEAKAMTVTVTSPDGLEAPMNAALLEQAVGNLLDNAIKYSGERTSVAVRARAQGAALEIQVCDEGPGIEKKHLPRVFERFYRVDQARSRALGGTGLGLAIVKHIALAHGGSVSVASEPGRGSTFTIRLPLS